MLNEQRCGKKRENTNQSVRVSFAIMSVTVTQRENTRSARRVFELHKPAVRIIQILLQQVRLPYTMAGKRRSVSVR